jgi:hypothetical protein
LKLHDVLKPTAWVFTGILLFGAANGDPSSDPSPKAQGTVLARSSSKHNALILGIPGKLTWRRITWSAPVPTHPQKSTLANPQTPPPVDQGRQEQDPKTLSVPVYWTANLSAAIPLVLVLFPAINPVQHSEGTDAKASPGSTIHIEPASDEALLSEAPPWQLLEDPGLQPPSADLRSKCQEGQDPPRIPGWVCLNHSNASPLTAHAQTQSWDEQNSLSVDGSRDATNSRLQDTLSPWIGRTGCAAARIPVCASFPNAPRAGYAP